MTSITSHLTSSLKQSCVLCGVTGHNDLCLCEDCLKELPFIEKSCFSCGIPLNVEQIKVEQIEAKQSLNVGHESTSAKNINHCGACISKPPPNTACVSLFHYQEPIDYLIKHMKYHNQLSIADLMGKLLVKKIADSKQPLPEQIIPVPLHFSRLQQRGYNQATEIARSISRSFNIPINLTDCSRTRNTTPQFDLPSNLRSDNLQDAFEIINKIPAKHVAIIDDIMTTGSTVWELSHALLASGIERVDIWTCARATIQ